MLRFWIIALGLLSSLNAAEDEFFEAKSTLGGYGELHFNQSKVEDEDLSPGSLDFHRFVLFYGHAWSPNWSFKSEVELEHNMVGKDYGGELELEQAYINYHHSNNFNFGAGVLLPSVGLLNENHEPPLFLSVERPDYNSRIIPTTWFGNGISANGLLAGVVDYKLVLMEGLNSGKFSQGSAMRSGRQKGQRSSLETILVNARIDYIGAPGLRAGASFSRNHLMENASGEQAYDAANLMEIHAKYSANNVMALAELGMIQYDALSSADGFLESSFGYYLQAGYNVLSLAGYKAQLFPFLHFSQYNTAMSVQGGGDAEEANQVMEWKVGLSFLPIPEVSFKGDIGIQTKGMDDTQTLQINLGAGYMF